MLIVQAEADALEIGQALKCATGPVAKSVEQNNMEKVNSRYEVLCKRREILQSEVAETRLTDSAIQELIEFEQAVLLGYKMLTFKQRGVILRC